MKKFGDIFFYSSFLIQSCVSILISFLVVFLIGKEAFVFFEQIPLKDFFLSTQWRPLLEPSSFGFWPLLIGSVQIVFGAILLSLPIGLGLAIFTQEYGKKIRFILKPILEILAGIPTVVYGYFALSFITPLLKKVFPELEIFNALSASIVVGLMILPMICSLCDDAFNSLPSFLKQGAYALGARSFEVILFVIIPASYRRILAACVLAISRALGETMAVSLAAGSSPQMGFDFFKGIQTMTAYIVQVSLGDTPQTGMAYLSSFAIAGILFMITLFFNTLAHLLVFKKDLYEKTAI